MKPLKGHNRGTKPGFTDPVPPGLLNYCARTHRHTPVILYLVLQGFIQILFLLSSAGCASAFPPGTLRTVPARSLVNAVCIRLNTHLTADYVPALSSFLGLELGQTYKTQAISLHCTSIKCLYTHGIFALYIHCGFFCVCVYAFVYSSTSWVYAERATYL